jgi:predicted ATPase/serine/threonine protein kinase
MTLPNGTRLGQYEILSPLGAGGMGEVYRARDGRLGREVAIKVLPADVASDEELLSRFEQEARSASSLNHPSIVTIYEIGESGSTRYIAMELVEGKTLKELIAPGPLPVRKVLSFASQIAEGLASAHAAGIVHRDLKPDNVMISNDGFVKILDFGLASRRPLDAAGKEQTAAGPMAENTLTAAPTLAASLPLTAAGAILGTVGYMSPEQATGRRVDFRSDQFSLASVIYEMGTGKRAFQKESPTETLAAILRDDPEPILAINARVPAPLGWIVERCLAKDPDERYASTRDLARDLAAVRERLDTQPETRASRETNLPPQRTRFVGRGREVAAAKDLLLRQDVRLLTLTGPGGIGKTRLALQAAGEIADQFPGGIFYVPLAPIGDPDLIASTISQTLGARESGGPPLEALKEYLQSSRAATLLLLDSFEHLIETAPIVADLVAAAPGLKVLITSRSPLHVYGEHEFPVPPLALPDIRKLPLLDVLADNEAVALFVQRAAAVKPGFAVTEENGAAIAEICARLDGLPLAIELAAARVKLLSPGLMLARLQKRLHLLTGGARDLPERQQTLRGAIDWSHDLLNEPEQKLFRRLSVFVGGCTLEAAEAVCNAKGDLGLDVLEAMASLMDKSLVQQPEPGAGEPRFAMLETIREYALERLASSGDEPITRRAHAAYCLVLAEEEATEPGGAESAGTLDRFDAEHGDFRAALDHLTESGDAEWGLRLAAALFPFWEAREHFGEGRERLDALLKLPGGTARIRARALFATGVLAGEQGDYADAQRLIEESLKIDREQNDTRGIAVALNALAVTTLERGDPEAAKPLFEESLALWRGFGDRVAVARSLSNLANVAKVQKNYATARSLHEETLAIFRDLGDRTGVAWALNHQADAAREQGDLDAARALYAQSLAAFRALGDRWGIAGTLDDLGTLARDQGDYAAARASYEESLTIFHDLEHKRGVARVLESFAGCAAGERQPRRALLLAGAAAALREKLGAPLPRAEQARLERSLEPAREALPDRDGAAVWMEGWAMPAEKAIEIALASGSA